jgi:polyhydroxyalkanoate synthesis regulator protein
MFAPFTTFDQRYDAPKPDEEAKAEPQPSQQEEIAELKTQLSAIQEQLEKLASDKR